MSTWTGRTLFVDNYDSFSWNIVHQLRALGDDPVVIRNDALDLDALERDPPDRLVIGPGPRTPHQAVGVIPAIRRLAPHVAILGICLGHQSIGVAFGMSVGRRPPVHGKVSPVEHDGSGLFTGLPSPLHVARYHSLVLEEDTLPAELRPTAWVEEGDRRTLMGIRHRDLPVEGVQFHPDSFLTEHGTALVQRFLAISSPQRR